MSDVEPITVEELEAYVDMGYVGAVATTKGWNIANAYLVDRIRKALEQRERLMSAIERTRRLDMRGASGRGWYFEKRSQGWVIRVETVPNFLADVLPVIKYASIADALAAADKLEDNYESH